MPRLTQFSPGAGCGCKISPRDLETILSGTKTTQQQFKNLIVGNNTKDDAAVYDLENGTSIISTTDFFTPIVDDPYYFGKIASVNAISDIYAMGGTPLMAIAILGWPLEKLPAEIASKVIDGAKDACKEAGIPLAGGHSIDICDPIFGLAVTGTIETANIKKNCSATENCSLYLTKPLGIGLLTTAEKRSQLKDEHKNIAIELMSKLNKIGEKLGKLNCVKAMTDVTGFGLLGHLLEVCEGSNLNAQLEFNAIPKIKGYEDYIELKTIPGGTYRNWKSYGDKIAKITEQQKFILCDPQTSGGLLIAVEQSEEKAFFKIIEEAELELTKIGYLYQRESLNQPFIYINE